MDGARPTVLPQEEGWQGSIGGGGGFWYLHARVPKMAEPEFPNGNFRLFATMVFFGLGGWGCNPPRPMVYGHF